MSPAFARKRKFNKKGQCIEDGVLIGPIVPWSVVALVAIILGRGAVGKPQEVPVPPISKASSGGFELVATPSCLLQDDVSF
jgi:hypothetical protein